MFVCTSIFLWWKKTYRFIPVVVDLAYGSLVADGPALTLTPTPTLAPRPAPAPAPTFTPCTPPLDDADDDGSPNSEAKTSSSDAVLNERSGAKFQNFDAIYFWWRAKFFRWVFLSIFLFFIFFFYFANERRENTRGLLGYCCTYFGVCVCMEHIFVDRHWLMMVLKCFFFCLIWFSVKLALVMLVW